MTERQIWTQEDLKKLAPVDQTILRIIRARELAGLPADIHQVTAAFRTRTPYELVSTEKRRTYKALNFPMMYGRGWESRAESMEMEPLKKLSPEDLAQARSIGLLPQTEERA